MAETKEADVRSGGTIFWDEKAMKILRWLRDHGYSPEQVEQAMKGLECDACRQKEPRR